MQEKSCANVTKECYRNSKLTKMWPKISNLNKQTNNENGIRNETFTKNCKKPQKSDKKLHCLKYNHKLITINKLDLKEKTVNLTESVKYKN